MSQIIKIEKVNLWYDKGKPTEVHALKDISIGIEKGDYVAFFGPSGCGKTTMLYAISGIDRFQEGKVLINNRDISGLSNQELAIFRQTGIGIVFQQFNLVPSLNVLKNVALPMLFVGITSEKAEIEARKLLERLDMLQYADRLPFELSGGQQQRIGIARALANNPPIIIADEPLGNLDSKNAQMVLEFLKELNEKDGRTVIMVTHESWSLRDVKTIFYMKDGVIIDTEKTKMNPSSDVIPPVITLTGPNPMMVVKNTKYIEQGAIALDALDGICTVTISGSVDTSTLGSYIITYTSIDKAGNVATDTRTVKVVLTTFDIVATSGPHGTVAPFGITLAKYKSSQTYNITPDDGFKVATLTVDGVNLEVANTFTFLSIDRSHTITATFSDITPPVITLNGADPMSVTKDSMYDELGAVALDALDGKCEVTISGSVDTSVLGSYTITYTSIDKAGNVATKTRIINVTLSPKKDTDTDIDIDDNIKYNKEEKPSIRVLANYLLRGSMDEIRRFETFVNDKFDEKISKEEFCILLNKQFKDGGVGLRKKKAEKIANYLEEIVENRKIIRRIYSILDENPEASISDEINSIRNWLIEGYKGKMSQLKVMAFDQVISDRIRDFIPASKVVEILDLSNNRFGVGFSFRAAQSMAEKLELILSNENDKSNSDNMLEKKL